MGIHCRRHTCSLILVNLALLHTTYGLLSRPGLRHPASSTPPQERRMRGLAVMSAVATPPRVVVTGLGPISGVGMDQTNFFEGLVEGRSSLHEVTRFDVTDFPTKIASEVSPCL